MQAKQAEFRRRETCVACESTNVTPLASGRYHENPVKKYFENDPWGVQPLPHLEDAEWDIAKCEDCGQLFHRSILTDEWLGVYYSEWISAEAIDAFYIQVHEQAKYKRKFEKTQHAVERTMTIEKLTRPICKDEPVRLLDFGSGDGEFLKIANSFGFDCFGVEFASSRDEVDGITIYSGLDDLQTEVALGSLHAITLFEVLEHLAEPLETLRTLNSYLKKGGVLVLETPNAKGVTGIEAEEDYRVMYPLGHINGFTGNSMKTICRKAGFESAGPQVVQLTAEWHRVYKREARRFATPFMDAGTRQYFRKIEDWRG